MPGIDPHKDVEITVSDHTLHLRAERREESKTEDDVSASYTDGILEVRIPIDTDQASAEKIPIERK